MQPSKKSAQSPELKTPTIAQSPPGLFPGEKRPGKADGTQPRSPQCAPCPGILCELFSRQSSSRESWGVLSSRREAKGIRVSHISQRVWGQGDIPGHGVPGGLRGGTHSRARGAEMKGVRCHRPCNGRVWVRIKRSSHSNEDTIRTLVFGARFPPHANAWNPLLKKGGVTMVFVGTLKIWSEKTKSGKCSQKHSDPFMQAGWWSPLRVCARDKNAKIQRSQRPSRSERIMRNQSPIDKRKITWKDRHDFITLLQLLKNDPRVLITDQTVHKPWDSSGRHGLTTYLLQLIKLNEFNNILCKLQVTDDIHFSGRCFTCYFPTWEHAF